jgi:PhnB protein
VYIPEGYGTVFPYMIVDGADDFVDFLSNVFGAVEVGRTVLPDGRLANVRLRIGTSTFMVSQAAADAMKAMAGAYYVFVEDVDATFDKACAMGALEIFAPADMPYQDRQAGVQDPCGNFWWISRRLVDAPYDG